MVIIHGPAAPESWACRGLNGPSGDDHRVASAGAGAAGAAALPLVLPYQDACLFACNVILSPFGFLSPMIATLDRQLRCTAWALYCD